MRNSALLFSLVFGCAACGQMVTDDSTRPAKDRSQRFGATSEAVTDHSGTTDDASADGDGDSDSDSDAGDADTGDATDTGDTGDTDDTTTSDGDLEIDSDVVTTNGAAYTGADATLTIVGVRRDEDDDEDAAHIRITGSDGVPHELTWPAEDAVLTIPDLCKDRQLALTVEVIDQGSTYPVSCVAGMRQGAQGVYLGFEDECDDGIEDADDNILVLSCPKSEVAVTGLAETMTDLEDWRD